MSRIDTVSSVALDVGNSTAAYQDERHPSTGADTSQFQAIADYDLSFDIFLAIVGIGIETRAAAGPSWIDLVMRARQDFFSTRDGPGIWTSFPLS